MKTNKAKAVCVSTCNKCGFSHTLFFPFDGECARCGSTYWLASWIDQPHPETVAQAVRESRES